MGDSSLLMEVSRLKAGRPSRLQLKGDVIPVTGTRAVLTAAESPGVTLNRGIRRGSRCWEVKQANSKCHHLSQHLGLLYY